jgi:signal transduction histidine kinase
MTEARPPSARERLRWLDLLRYAVIALFAASVVGLLFAAAAAWRMEGIPFAGVLTEPTLVVSDLGNPSWSGYAAGLGSPHRVVAVGGHPLRYPGSLVDVVTGYTEGQTVGVMAQDPATGTVSEARVLLRHLPWNAFLGFFLIPSLVGWTCLAVGIRVLRCAPRDEVASVVAAFCANLALLGGLFFDAFTTHLLWWAWAVLVPLAGSLGLHLACVFPERLGLFRRARWLPLLVYVPGLALGAASVLVTARWNAPVAYFGPWLWGRVWAGVGAVGLAVLMISRRILSRSPLIRTQARTVLSGAVAGLAPCAVWLLTARWASAPFTPALVLPWTVLFPLSVGHTLLRRRALDIDWVVRRALSYLLLFAAVVLGYLLVLTALDWGLRLHVSAFHPLVLAVPALAVALGVHPARLVIQRAVDRAVLGRRVTPERALREFAREAAAARTVEEALAALGRAVERALAAPYSLLYLSDERLGCYVPRVLSGAAPAEVRFRPEGPLARRMETTSQPLYLAVAEGLPPELEAERARLADLGQALFVPLPGQGWLTVGPTRLGRFRAADAWFLEALAPQVVAALERVGLISDLERRLEELEVLRLIAQAVSYSVELDDLLELIYTQTSRVLGVANFYITLHAPESRTLHYAFCVEENERRFPAGVWPDTEGLGGWIIRAGQPVVTDDYALECERRGVQAGRRPGKAWMGMPLISRDRVLGVMSVSSSDPRTTFTQEQAEFFRAVANQAAAIVDKVRLYQEMEKRARQLEALNEVGGVITSTLELDATLRMIMRKAIELLQADSGSLLLRDESGDLVFRVVSGSHAADLVGTRLPLGAGIVGRVAKEARPIIVADVDQDEGWYPGLETGSDFVTRSAVCVPLIARGQVIGVIELLNRRDGRSFGTEDRSLLTAFASQAAVAIENARLFTQTDQALAARVDELSMMQRIDRELNATLDYQRVMEITLDWALQMTGADIGLVAAIVETEEGESRLRILANRGYPEEVLSARDASPLSLGRGVLGRAVRTGKPQFGVRGDSYSDYAQAVAGMMVQLVVPIGREEQIIGVITLESSEDGGFSQEALESVIRLTDHAAVAIENARLFDAVQAANDAKTDFISFVSHELKQPMTSIKGYADLLAKGTGGELGEMQQSFLGVIRTNVDRMDALVQDLLDVSRIEAGRLRLELGRVPMEEVVEEAVRGVRRQVEAKGQTLDVQVCEGLPPVAADRNRLVQVLVNLLSNAYKYTPEGGHIRLLVESIDGGYVRCAVSDTGTGLSEEDQERLFTKYFRSQDPAVRSVPGTGLGLVITKSLVELQGGEISVESTLGEGSTFAFTVPVASD